MQRHLNLAGPPEFSRRRFLERSGLGLGSLALAYLLEADALGRAPTAAETGFCREYLRRQAEVYRQSSSPPAQAAEQALAGLCAALLASNEFLYIG